VYVTYNGSYERCAKDEEAVEEMLEENTGAETGKNGKNEGVETAKLR